LSHVQEKKVMQVLKQHSLLVSIILCSVFATPATLYADLEKCVVTFARDGSVIKSITTRHSDSSRTLSYSVSDFSVEGTSVTTEHTVYEQSTEEDAPDFCPDGCDQTTNCMVWDCDESVTIADSHSTTAEDHLVGCTPRIDPTLESYDTVAVAPADVTVDEQATGDYSTDSDGGTLEEDTLLDSTAYDASPDGVVEGDDSAYIDGAEEASTWGSEVDELCETCDEGSNLVEDEASDPALDFNEGSEFIDEGEGIV
jgi:hypothetical protein